MRATVNLHTLLVLLQRIDAQPHVTRQQLAEWMQLSAPTITRLFIVARDVCDVRYEWDMKNGYRITHWGVFDSRKIRAWRRVR